MEIPEFDVWRDSFGMLHARHRPFGVEVQAEHPRYLRLLAARVLYIWFVGDRS
ncbi:hypothetical protein ACTWPT_44580 [Nonomuraea sp. 3N208]|uniref:hypothetical protein n=1 Tax=Nonomuraea sp. 3N208 TaxID=3457421 RepID=UPI003FD1052F